MANVKRKNAAVNESKRPAAQIEAANDNASRAVLLKQERAALPRSTHEGVVRFGEIEADGFVLENGTACLSRRGVLRLLTGREDGTGDLGKLSRSLWKTLGNLPQPNLAQNGTLPQKNSGGLPQPNLAFLRFTAADGSAVVDGLDADSIVDLFQLYVKALEKGVLRADQIPLAARAAIVLGAVAREGLRLAIYSATGAQQYLQAQLVEDRIAASLRKEAGRWERLFTEEFFIALAKLLRVEASRKGKRPTVFAAFLSRYFYEWWDAETYAELRRRNPDPVNGPRHHQFLTDFARERFKQHQRDVLLLLKSSSSLGDFDNRFRAAFNGRGLQLSFG